MFCILNICILPNHVIIKQGGYMRKKFLSVMIVIILVGLGGICFAQDNVPPSQNPPNNLPVKYVPQFIVLGFDDQPSEAGMNAVLNLMDGMKNPEGLGQEETFDGTSAQITFYSNSANFSATENAHKKAIADGHEIANHTASHTTSFSTSEGTWTSEINQCNSGIVGLGVPEDQIFGFRTPYLQYNDATFKALASIDFLYDCSIEEGWDAKQNAGNFLWPHTLDNGSPGNKVMVDWNDPDLPYELIESHPGLWEMPCYVITIPADSLCEKYDLPERLRNRIKTQSPAGAYFDTINGKITGLDYNLYFEAGLVGMEIGKVLCYNLDCFYNGNRTPLNYGTHSRYYTGELPNGIEGLEYFLDYALKKPDVRIVSAINVVRWMQNPKLLDPSSNVVAKSGAAKMSIASVQVKTVGSHSIQINGLAPGTYEIALFTLDGQMVASISKNFDRVGSTIINLTTTPVNANVLIASIKNSRITMTQKVHLVK